jgi:large subunit ribosomal protein L15
VEDEIQRKKAEELAKLEVNVLKTQIAEAETVEVIKKDKKKKVFMI